MEAQEEFTRPSTLSNKTELAGWCLLGRSIFHVLIYHCAY